MKNIIPKPTLADIELLINKLIRKYPQLVETEIIGYSPLHLPVRMVKVTDRQYAAVNKTNVLIVGGHHGDEESGRAACVGTLEWLVTKEAREVLKTQQILLVPSINVDGTSVNKHWNSNNINICSDYGAATQPETRAVIKVADKYKPEVTVDVHGLAGGAIHEMVMQVQTREYCLDEWLHNLLIRDMREAAEKKGYPMDGHSLSWNGWFDGDFKKPAHLNTYCYKKYHSFGILTEGNEATYDYKQMKESGSARLIGLLKAGVNKYSFEYYPGYPCSIISGSMFFAITSAGETAEARRNSTAEIMENLDFFTNGRNTPVKKGLAVRTIKYTGAVLTKGIGFRHRIQGAVKPGTVTLNGKKLKLSATDGYIIWRDKCSTFIQCNIPVFVPGEYNMTIKY